MRQWLREHPRLLELAYEAAYACVTMVRPLIEHLGYERADRWFRPLERWTKGWLFDCRMCGQCVLHSTGMTCPMTCPKNLRNGPCGGVRADGHCEVIPSMKCIWVNAFEGARRLRSYGSEIISIQPPVNHRIEGSSAWVNMLTGADRQLPKGWTELPDISVIERRL